MLQWVWSLGGQAFGQQWIPQATKQKRSAAMDPWNKSGWSGKHTHNLLEALEHHCCCRQGNRFSFCLVKLFRAHLLTLKALTIPLSIFNWMQCLNIFEQTSTYHQALPYILTQDAAAVYLLMRAETPQTVESAGSTKVEHISHTEWSILIFLITIFLKMRSDLETHNTLTHICRWWLAPNFKEPQLPLLYQVQHNILSPRLECN